MLQLLNMIANSDSKSPSPRHSMPDLGPLDPLLKDPKVTEIMINDIRNIMIEKEGKIEPFHFNYSQIDELNRLLQTLLVAMGKTLSAESPYVDGVLPDGSRVHVIVSPVTLYGPCITIRKFPQRKLNVQDLVNQGTVSQKMSLFLNACVMGRLNILVCGGTGSGKTTLLNILTSFVPKNERIISIEDTPELVIRHANSVRLQTRVETNQTPSITARELIVNALRMRPDRILVGECRRGEAFDMLQAMNTGHSGSMTTLHANSPRDGLARLETLCMIAGTDLPLLAIRKQMTSAIDLIIQIKRFRDGKRRIVSIEEITGMESDTITLQQLFLFDPEHPNFFKPTGFVPTFLDRLEEEGVELPSSFFKE